MSKRWRRLLAAVAVLVMAALASAGCSLGSDDASGSSSDLDSSGQRRTARSEPPGSDPAAVRGSIEELLARYDEAVNAIIADPAVVRDRDDPVVQAYLEVFEPESQAAADALAGWAQSADAGMTVRPLNAESPAIVSTLDGVVETVSDDEVRFATCADHHYQQYDGSGTVQDVVDMVGRAGEGVAVRIDGRWRLRQLELRDDRPGCTAEGSNA